MEECIPYYLPAYKIDRQKWDRCIDNSMNGRIYAYSFYLDAMSDQWDAIVLNDYEVVMPLPWRKKWGIYYIYQPFLSAQLGVFGNSISSSLLNSFIEAIPGKFKLWEFPLNQQNVFDDVKVPFVLRKNYELSLKKDYDTLFRNYRENSKRNIRKALSYGCEVRQGIVIEDIIALNKAFSPGDSISESDYLCFHTLFSLLNKKGEASTYGIYLKDQLVASCCFLFSHKRAYYLLVGNHPNGRTLGASHLLIDAFIKDLAGQDLILDFEGSDLRNLAFFYSSFGAIAENYPAIYYNGLPWYLRMFKRER